MNEEGDGGIPIAASTSYFLVEAVEALRYARVDNGSNIWNIDSETESATCNHDVEVSGGFPHAPDGGNDLLSHC